IRDRPTETLDVVASVRQGLRRARDAGVGYLGDIAGSAQAVHARRTVPQELLLPGVSYLECFGIGEGEAEAARQIKTRLGELPFETPIPGHDRGIVLGIAPHAPYSTGLAVYDAAARLSQDRAYRVSTHLAEAPEEIAFVRDAAGPLADLLRELGKWDASIEPTGKHPVDHLEPALRRARWLVVHANYLEDSHLPLLRKAGASVVYCPVASDYFGHTGHRYRELLDAGVNVCLGTDSILCQPADPPDGQPLGILGQMRHLYRRDGADPELLLKMATTNGLLALEFDQRDASLHEGAPARFATVEIDPESRTDPLEQILTGNQPAAGLDLTGAERDQE
ncbi:MAG: amidohydrolase family protein, partial [Phycisphaeraceae bacterium]